MADEDVQVRAGSCTCGHVRYEVQSTPMVVHCCHCRGCQKNSGAAFALNALFEAENVELVSGSTEDITVPTPSGVGQIITRCSKCKVAVWSNYNMGGLKERIRFVRVGTLDYPDEFSPDVHIFTESKQPWVIIPEGDYKVDVFYNWADVWSPESMERLHAIEDAAGIIIS